MRNWSYKPLKLLETEACKDCGSALFKLLKNIQKWPAGVCPPYPPSRRRRFGGVAPSPSSGIKIYHPLQKAPSGTANTWFDPRITMSRFFVTLTQKQEV